MAISTEKILRLITVTLSPNEIEKAIKDYLEKEGFEVHGIDFKIATRTEGYGMGEHDIHEFNGAAVSCRIITERVTHELSNS